MKNEELLKKELHEKNNKVAILESSLEECERTNNLFLENLNRDNQTLQDTLKNSFFFEKIKINLNEKNRKRGNK